MDNKAKFYGHGGDIHDRIRQVRGNFRENLDRLRSGCTPVIAVHRKNCFHLDRVLSRIADELGRGADVSPFPPSPVNTIADRFRDHLDEMMLTAELSGIETEIDDPRLFELLDRVQSLASSHKETDLLRALGIVCDTVLVGPWWFIFETVNACNSDCLYCNIHSPSRKPSKEFLKDRMPFAIFRDTCDDLTAMGTEGVTILANGEPLLNPDFADMVRYAAQKKFTLNFFTNGLLFNNDIAALCIEHGVHEILVTISAAEESTYLKLHSRQHPGDFQRVLDQFAALRDMKQKAGKQFPEVTGVHVICAPNVHETPAMAKQAAELGFTRLRLALLRVDEHNRSLALTRDQIKTLLEQLPEVEAYCETHGVTLLPGYRFQLEHADDPAHWSGDAFVQNGCYIGFGLGLLKANADASFCCVVKPIANLKQGVRFRDVWNGWFYHEARVAAKRLTDVNDIRFTGDEPLYTDACRHCDNHDINVALHRLLDETGLREFI